jgi:uroporphyrin-3 C-methyltransferase
MSDKEVSKNELSPENKAEESETATVKTVAKKPSLSSTETDKTTAKNSAKPSPKPANKKTGSSNKVASIAIVIATVSIFSSIGHYIWQQQSNAQFLANNQKNQQSFQQSQSQLKNSLTAEFTRQLQQQHQARNQSQQSAKQAHLDSDNQLKLLTAQVSQLEQQVSQRQPSDWLVHEAEYLVRVAARTMWLEQDTKAAIGLLRDADNRLKTLNQPKFLPVRALINEDIETLALMPTLKNQEAILTLMALNKQIATLELAGVNLAEALDQTKEDFTLSDDIGDWQENLAKTWQKFLKDFITVRRRSGMVEPLMSPEQQQNLKQNLSLKVQLVQWAASEQKAEVYQQTLLDIQQWLNGYFDMESPVNKRFYQAIEQLKQQTIHYDYPSDLRSLTAIKHILADTKQGYQPQPNNKDNTESKLVEKEQTKIDQAIITDTQDTPASEKKEVIENDEISGDQL